MESLRVMPNIDRGVPEDVRAIAERVESPTNTFTVVGIPNGTAEGRPAVMFIAEVEGVPVVLQTTLALLESAVAGVRAGCS